jgi:hypothetical protein
MHVANNISDGDDASSESDASLSTTDSESSTDTHSAMSPESVSMDRILRVSLNLLLQLYHLSAVGPWWIHMS